MRRTEDILYATSTLPIIKQANTEQSSTEKSPPSFNYYLVAGTKSVDLTHKLAPT